jgi:2',3'-cyclic-nucleotide 2'-phosphodiesterase (5'-nucleotidase family)
VFAPLLLLPHFLFFASRERDILSAASRGGVELLPSMRLRCPSSSSKSPAGCTTTTAPATTLSLLLLWCVLLPLIQQHSAALVVALDLPIPNLPLGDVNVVVVTDVHSWVGGHRDKEPKSDADYGDVLSFVEHLKRYGLANRIDVWFVMNGDWIDGTGLAINGDASKLVPILENMPYDAMNVGNHELYRNQVIEYATQTAGMVQKFGPRYLSSNVLHNDTRKPIGREFRILRGVNANLLTFGFLYDMVNAGDRVTVQRVEDAVNEKWFVSALQDTETYDAILVLAHMDVRDPLCTVILNKIRSISSSVPVQFITGHTHRRDYQVLDANSVSFEAGRYLDTVGFVSFPSKPSSSTSTSSSLQAATEIASVLNATKNETTTTTTTNASTTTTTTESPFKYRFLDASKEALADAVGLPVESFPTENGLEQSEFITRIQIELGLRKVIGCSSDTYYFNRTLDAPESLWGLFVNDVVPDRFSGNQVLVIGSAAWRYNLFQGEVRFDDAIAVSPFNNTLYKWENVPAEVITELNNTLNAEPGICASLPLLPNYIVAPAEPFQPTGTYTLIADDFETGEIQKALEEIYPNATNWNPVAMPGVTTTSIWIDYFTNLRSCKRTDSKPHLPEIPSGIKNFASANSDADNVRLAFIVVAVACMAILGSIAVWQKGSAFSMYTNQREMATREALQEYDDDDYNDADCNDEEGEFV